ncbi:MAG: putative glycoside hydrolase [Bacillota bacterium]|nr:putative glycoside hydrolase [Bacillota bacterium]
MRKKKNKGIYIGYEKSYRGGARKQGSTFFAVIVVFILAGLIGVVTYYAVRINAGGEYSLNKEGMDVVHNNPNDELTRIDENTESDSWYVDVSVGNKTDKGKDVEANNEKGSHIDEEENNLDGLELDNRIPVEAKGIYVTSRAIMDKREQLLELADTTEINAMVIDVKDDNGRITFSMDSEKIKEVGSTTNTISDIEDLLKLLKEKEIYPIARIVAFKDPYLAEKRHDLAIKNKDGSLYRDNNGECWINPYEKEVWDYLIEVSTKAAEIGFMEIQFDYIRFSTGKGMSEAYFGPLAEEKSKEDIIIEFTKQAYDRLKPLGVFVSADVYGTIISSSIDAGLVGQNYVEMARYLDYICPMVYPSHFGEGNYGVDYPDLEPYKIIRKVMTASKNKLDEIPEGEHRAIVRPWLQDFTASWIKNHQVYGGDQLREQISAVYSVGYREWILWNAACNYSEDGLYND